MQIAYRPTPHNIFYFSPKCNSNLYQESKLLKSSFSVLQKVSAPQAEVSELHVIMYVISL